MTDIPEVRRSVVIDLTKPISRATWPDLSTNTRQYTGAWVEVVLSEDNAFKTELPRTVAMSCWTAAGITIRGGGKWATYFEDSLRRELQQLVREHDRFLDEQARRHGGSTP